MKQDIKLFSLMVFMIFLVSMDIWIGWDGRKPYFFLIFGLLASAIAIIKKIRFEFTSRNLLLCATYYVCYLLSLKNFEMEHVITQIFPHLIPIICIVCVEDKTKTIILHNITKWFSLIITISLCIYVIVLLTGISGIGRISYMGDAYGGYENYILYLRSMNTAGDAFERFNGPFLEPGHLGMMGAFLLYANSFNFKNRDNIVIGISVLLSFSLAGWMLCIIGYCFYTYYNEKIKLSRLFLIILVIFGSYQFGRLYNDGNNIINEKILTRLQYDEDKGFSGNNRNQIGIIELYESMWIRGDMDVILHGYPQTAFYAYADWQLVAAGFQNYVVRNGILAVIYVFMFYFIVTYTAIDKKYAILFLLFVIISFWQRTYAHWFAQIICFYYSTIMFDQKKIKQL